MQVHVVGVQAQADRERALRVEVDEQHLAAVLGERGAQVDGRRGLADATLLVAHRDDPRVAVGAERCAARAAPASDGRSGRAGPRRHRRGSGRAARRGPGRRRAARGRRRRRTASDVGTGSGRSRGRSSCGRGGVGVAGDLRTTSRHQRWHLGALLPGVPEPPDGCLVPKSFTRVPLVWPRCAKVDSSVCRAQRGDSTGDVSRPTTGSVDDGAIPVHLGMTCARRRRAVHRQRLPVHNSVHRPRHRMLSVTPGSRSVTVVEWFPQVGRRFLRCGVPAGAAVRTARGGARWRTPRAGCPR